MTQEKDESLSGPTPSTPSADPRQRLAEAVTPDESYSHDRAIEELPAYVVDELQYRSVSQLYPALHRHLLNCQSCAELHAELLTEFLNEPSAIAMPEPNLSFLPPMSHAPVPSYVEQLRTFVTRATEAILQRVDPKRLSEVGIAAEALFVRLGDRLEGFALVPAPQTAYGFSGRLSPTARYLAASLMATQRIGAQLSKQQIEELKAQSKLTAEVHKRALQAAFDMELGRDAATFAAEYTHWAVAQIDRLPFYG